MPNSNSIRTKWICLTVLILGVMIARVSVSANSLESPIANHVTISDSTGEVRILLDFGNLDQLEGKKIIYAKCLLTISLDTCETELQDIDFVPAIRAWDPSTVTWSEPWESPGGDFSADVGMHVTLRNNEDRHVEILVTSVIQAWADSQLANHGLILKLAKEGCRFGLVSTDSYPGDGFGELIVKYVDRTQ